MWPSNNHIEVVVEGFKLDEFVNLLLNFIAQNHDGAHAVKVQSQRLLSCDSKFLDCKLIVILVLILVEEILFVNCRNVFLSLIFFQNVCFWI